MSRYGNQGGLAAIVTSGGDGPRLDQEALRNSHHSLSELTGIA